MDERVLRFRVGVVVVAAAIITIILITLLGAWPSPFKDRYTVYVEFDKAPGVTIDTPVRKSGIQIGRVSDVELLDNGRVLLTLRMDADYQLKSDQVCRISTGSVVTGDALLEWVKSEVPTEIPTPFIEDGDYLKRGGRVATDPFEMLGGLEQQVESALVSLEQAGTDVGQVAQGMNRILGSKEDQIETMVDEAVLALRNFNSVMENLQEISGDENLQAQLRDTVEKLPELFAQAQTTLDEVQGTLQKFSGVAIRAERNLANLEDFTAPLGERGDEISQGLVDSISGVNRLVENLAELSQALRNEDGTVGQLINNPELYERANRMLKEVEMLVRKLEPIIDDVRTISDKVARDPAQMGVKGILDRRPSGVGQKYPTTTGQRLPQSLRLQ